MFARHYMEPEDTVDEDLLAVTRRSLHAVGELVVAGPQYREHGTIRLRPVAGGFAGTRLDVAVDGGDLVSAGGRLALDGRSCRELAAAAGLVAGAPDGLYHEGCGMDVDSDLDASTRRRHASARTGSRPADAALTSFAPHLESVLWPEHFDLGVTLDEVNYGASLGDGFHAAPYAYVGPWKQRDGAFWNAPFGAVRSFRELPDVAAIAAFFAEGRTQAS